MAKKLIVGLDFDGVLAYNPTRLIRAPIKWFKRRVLKIRRLSFFVPKNEWQKWLWVLMFESSVWPARGVKQLKEDVENGRIEVHLVTGRFGFMNKSLYEWLDKYQLRTVFKSISVNEEGEQPHLFKERVIKKLKLDWYVEDNLDIVLYLKDKVQTQVAWIYNLVDKNFPYEKKFPYLERVLQYIREQKN